MSEPRQIGVILEEILEELRKMNGATEKKRRSNDRLLNASKAAGLIGVSAPTLRRYRALGRIKPVMRGGRTGYLESDLLKIKDV